ncbi:MAG TPA: hypothetical protein VE268_04910, partial [Herpetosiphonaceae bacterium]|nr:hypothetical protein [Herpetosiphonaceae bacterium]
TEHVGGAELGCGGNECLGADGAVRGRQDAGISRRTACKGAPGGAARQQRGHSAERQQVQDRGDEQPSRAL